MNQNHVELESALRSVMKEENDSSELSVSSPGCVNNPVTSSEEKQKASSSAYDPQSHEYKFNYGETCPVCGDKVSGYHYGLLTCESCKGFFKRTVQNKKVYSCVDNRSCPIDKSQRKRCPYCRFKKCLNVGMKLEAVRHDRMRGGRNKFGPMYKQDRALKQQAQQQQQQILENCQMRLAFDLEPFPVTVVGDPLDIKPDLAFLMSVEISLGYGTNNVNNSQSQYSSDSLAESEIPSPTRSDNSPMNHQLSIPASSLSKSAENVTQNSRGINSDSGSIFQSSGGFVSSTYNYQALAHPSDIPLLPHLIVDMKNSALDEWKIKMKLLSFVDSDGHDEMNNNYLSKMLCLLCHLTDQLLFFMVEWARTSVFFRELKVEDQMKLLQSCWSEILVLDLAHRLLRQIWSGELLLANGHRLNLECLSDLGLTDLKDRVLEIVRKMKELKIDDNEYTCLKFLILLNPDVVNLENQEFVESCQERVQAVLVEYCATFYPSVKDKFSQVLLRLPDIKLASITAKTFLFNKHLSSELPEQTLLMELLHSIKK